MDTPYTDVHPNIIGGGIFGSPAEWVSMPLGHIPQTDPVGSRNGSGGAGSPETAGSEWLNSRTSRRCTGGEGPARHGLAPNPLEVA